MAARTVLTGGLAAILLCSACSSAAEPAADPETQSAPSSSATTTAPPATTPTPTPSATPPAHPEDARASTAMAAVRHLSRRIGPRHGTSLAYAAAADWVQGRMERSGWRVRRQPVPTPAGVSWGVPVPAGRSVNLVATLPAADARPGPWLLVGAHLDTVPQAPGAEDNASGVGVLLAVAEALRGVRTRLPVVLVAFGSEEPRGPGDDDHHYGSRVFVDSLTRQQRRTLRGMVSLDRVGVGAVLPISSAGAPDRLRAQLLAAARRAQVSAEPRTDERSSDHWSFVRDGLPGVRLGSTPYAGYHSPGDVAAVVSPGQLHRAARTLLAWVAPR